MSLGAARAEITLVEYGSYDCPHCRAANARIAEVRDQLGERVRYVFRHRPISGSELARRAAELVEQAATPDEFWSAHVSLMTRSRTLTEDDLRAVADDLRLGDNPPDVAAALEARGPRARRRGRRQLARQRRALHAHVLHQRPALRRPLGRGLVHRRHAGLARPSRAHRGAGVRELGAVHRRVAAAGHPVSRRPHQHGCGPGVHALLGDGARRSASATPHSACRCCTG